ncbi:ribosome recycling factor [Desulfomicrobium baculatum]|uniref:Ribosome-recycling factor n=1 Tax=Desulfomicrobium baculatum (strain DSM 4028 / VKM B-1378 / X) TaxID=525897 RepID=C7LR52_DESBD|nr:ribosome recycling factor [Desulfomicrobium baculatum]ACU90458.1 ribosome recycling factor [Desulfomicrobium baculatum DSM 4028]
MEKHTQDCTNRMQKSIDSLEKDFSKLRTGRASTALVDSIRVEYYGTPTPLNQVASVSIPDSRTISISPWDRNAFNSIEKAIMKSDLGLTPINDGRAIRINIPVLTEERRKDLVKMAKKYTEEAKVAIRNVRRDVNDALKKMHTAKEISEDDLHKAQDEVQKTTDNFVKKADAVLAEKEKEIMEI